MPTILPHSIYSVPHTGQRLALAFPHCSDAIERSRIGWMTGERFRKESLVPGTGRLSS